MAERVRPDRPENAYPDQPMQQEHRSLPIGPALAFAAVGMLLWLQWNGVRKGIWVDSDVYVMGARAVMHHTDLYATVSQVDLRFTYPPFAATLFVPLALLPVEVARVLLTLASLASYVGAIYLVGRRLELAPWKIAWLALAGLSLEPLLRTLLLGQVNLFLLLLVVVDALVVPPKYRGYLIGVAAGIKITPAVFLFYFLVRREWAAALRVSASFAATVAVGWLVAPRDSWDFWSGGVFGLGRFGDDAPLGTDNQSLMAVVLRMLRIPSMPMWGQLLLALAGIALGVCAAVRTQRTASGPAAQVAALVWIAIGGLLASPVSWSHHWVWIVPAIGVLIAQRRFVSASVVTAAFWFPTIWITYTEVDFGELQFPLWRQLASTVYAVVGVVLLLQAIFAPRRPPVEKEPDHSPDSLDRAARESRTP